MCRQEETSEYISLEEACRMLQISVATGQNWIRQGRWEPVLRERGRCLFRLADVDNLIQRVKDGSEEVLRSRRNKSRISGRRIYDSYVSESCRSLASVRCLIRLLNKKDVVDKNLIACILADAALALIPGDEAESDEGRLYSFIRGEREPSDPAASIFLRELLPEHSAKLVLADPELFGLPYIYEEGQDILGLIYMSCRELGSRKKAGAYYTPTTQVRRMMDRLFSADTCNSINNEASPGRWGKSDDSYRQLMADGGHLSQYLPGTDVAYGDILDPCCGTGNFLLQLPKDFPLEKIYGNDLDEISVKVTRLNLAMRYPGSDPQLIRSHITRKNFLTEFEDSPQYRYVIGNPPWGSQWTEEEMQFLNCHFRTAKRESSRNADSADVFLEKALRCTREMGQIAFVMPEAILQVRSHQEIRSILVKECDLEYIEYMGDIFPGVQCPSILLQLRKTEKAMRIQGLHVIEKGRSFTIQKEREVRADMLTFQIDDDEYRLLQEIDQLPGLQYLKNQADFALGIVTGDNRRWMQKLVDSEPILRGSEVNAFHRCKPRDSILYRPKAYQQMAREEYYRAPEKLVYRFIAEYPIVSWDPDQLLTLNSCNILIPKIPDMDMRYVMAVLNSEIIRFCYRKKFRTVKVLRSHLEQMPIPSVSPETMKEIVALTEELRDAGGEKEEMLLARLNEMIRIIFCVDEDDYHKVIESNRESDKKKEILR